MSVIRIITQGIILDSYKTYVDQILVKQVAQRHSKNVVAPVSEFGSSIKAQLLEDPTHFEESRQHSQQPKKISFW